MLALRTQQVLAYESGVTQTADPLGGSHYVEALTDCIEGDARSLLAQIEQGGGAAAAIARGDFQEAIHRSAYAYQQAVESGDTVVVGVNQFTEDEPPPPIPAPDYGALEERQVRQLRQGRQQRQEGQWRQALDALASAARGTEPLMRPILAAVRARATVGEISDTLRAVWGVHRPHV
jgi:methylmalonyl-CoA mutase N-terminal domain/subunit